MVGSTGQARTEIKLETMLVRGNGTEDKLRVERRQVVAEPDAAFSYAGEKDYRGKCATRCLSVHF